MKKLLLLSTIALCLIPFHASAQANSVLLSPDRSDFTVQSGSTVRVPITLQNTSNKLVTLTVVSKDFEASKNLDGQPSQVDSSVYGISNWFSEANLDKKLTVPANQTIKYEAVFRVPNGLTPRTYFGSVAFVQESGDSVGSLVFITIGNPETKLMIEDLSFGESDEAANSHGVFTAVLKNTSEGLSTPKFKLRITNGVGKTVLELDQDNEGSVLPNSSRRFTFSPAAELPNEMLTATLTAVDQNGTTADKSLQIDRKLTESNGFGSEIPNNNNQLNIELIVAVITALTTITLFVIWHRKKASVKQVITPETQNLTPIPKDNTNEKYTNSH